MDRSNVVRVDDVALLVHALGRPRPDAPPLVVVHGGPDWDHTYLLPGLALIARTRQVVAFDLRGCGGSTQGLGPAGYQPGFVVADLLGLLDALGHQRVDLLGFSTGGQVAQLAVEAFPERVRRLVLASTTAYPDVAGYLVGWGDYEQRLAMRAPWPPWAGFDRGQPRNDVEATIEWAVESAPVSIANLDRLEDYLELLSGVRFTGEWIGPFRKGLLRSWRPREPENVLGQFPGEILILHGDQDMTFPVQLAQRLRDAVPSSRLAVIKDAGHMAHSTSPWSGPTKHRRFLTDEGSRSRSKCAFERAASGMSVA